MPFDFSRVKDWLRCPQSGAELILDGDSLVGCDPETRLRYPIRDEIPIMLVDEAEEVSLERWQALMTQHDRDAESGSHLK